MVTNLGRVLVTGSTGRIGKEVVARLSQAGLATVRASLHSPSKQAYLESLGAKEVVPFDLTKPESWPAALDGVDVLFSSSLDPLLQGHLQFMKYLKQNPGNVSHIVRISCFGADTNTASYDANVHVSRKEAPIPLMLQHYWWAEEACINTGIPTTAIRGNFFMNHLLKNEQESIREDGVFRSPLGSCKNSFVCTNDMAEAAVTVMAEGPQRHGNKFYDITGPESQSMHDVAAVLSGVMGRQVRYEEQDIDTFEKDFGSTRAEFFEYLRNGFYSRCSPDFYNLTGRKPTSYRDYLTVKGAAGETGLEELFQAGMFKKGEDKFSGLKDVKRDAA